MTCVRFTYNAFPNRNQHKYVGNLKQTKLCAYDVMSQKQELLQGTFVVVQKLFVYNVVFMFKLGRTARSVSRADLASVV